MILNLLANLSYYVPELICIILMCSLLFLESTYKRETGRSMIYITSIIGLVAASVVLISALGDPAVKIFSNSVVIDPFSTLLKLLMVLGTLGCILISSQSNEIYSTLKSEFIIMALGILVGAMLLASANNLLTVYIGIETLSILAYVMSAFKKDDSTSSEAGMKYALYGGMASGVMLYGMSHLYGIAGGIQFEQISTVIKEVEGLQFAAMLISFILFFVGVGYKIACFPFHMWSPDVYQGSPVPVTSFFSIVPKFAGLAVLVRISLMFFSEPGQMSNAWILLIHIIAALTMTVGNVTAIGQDSVKRLLAFSSIGHVGMMLLGVVALNEAGASSIVFYAIVYLFMTLAAFLITAHVSSKYDTDSQSIFRGLIKTHPYIALAMIFVLYSLAGLPPFSGFVAKFNIINVVIEKKYYGLAFIAAVNSVISLYYYMRLVRVIVFDKSVGEQKIESLTFVQQLAIVAITVPVLVFGVFWGKIMALSKGATLFIQ